MAKTIKLCDVHSFSTSLDVCQCTTVLNADVPNCYCYCYQSTYTRPVVRAEITRPNTDYFVDFRFLISLFQNQEYYD